MRTTWSWFKLEYLLPFLLTLFGALYLTERIYRDLWANLFAAVIAVTLIDLFIIRHSEMQRSERSRNFARYSVFYICNKIIGQMHAPRSWMRNLESFDREWYENYKQRIFATRREATDRLETILERYSYLLNVELQNDIFDMLTVLGTFYDAIETMYPVFDEKTKFDAIFHIANLAATTMNHSINIIKSHKLLESVDFGFAYKYGEPPKLAHKIMVLSKSNISSFENMLEDATKFRDGYWDATEKKSAKN